MEKSATLLAHLLSKLINEQGGIFRLLHEKLRAGWKENLKNISEHALLLGTSEYVAVSDFGTRQLNLRKSDNGFISKKIN